MKKVILCFCALGFMHFAQAQKKKGNVKFKAPVVKKNVQMVNADIPLPPEPDAAPIPPPPPPPPPPPKVKKRVPPPPPKMRKGVAVKITKPVYIP